jgi:hypothetical protein
MFQFQIVPNSVTRSALGTAPSVPRPCFWAAWTLGAVPGLPAKELKPAGLSCHGSVGWRIWTLIQALATYDDVVIS